jgi:flagellar motor protein MotB
VRRTARRGCLVASLALGFVACGGVGAPVDLREYKRLRFSQGGEDVARRLPKLTAEADARFAEAVAAEDAGRTDEAQHLARLARYQFLAAEAYSQRKIQQMRLAETLNRQRLLDERLADARQRERSAVEAQERAQRMADMTARTRALPDAAQAQRIFGALADLEAAYAREAARLAPADELQARNALNGALKALTAGRATPETDLAVDRAVLHCQRLLADVTPRFEEEKRRAAVEARLRELLAQASRVPEVEARLEGRGLVLTLRQLFADGSTEVMPHRLTLVDQVATLLDGAGPQPIRVEGHTEARADADLAVETSAKRAASVRVRLETRGIPADRLESIGRGGADPIADNRSKDGKSLNRRIEIVVLRKTAATSLNRSGDRAP